MNASEHKAEAERMADEAQRANTAEWSTAYATRALVHATLAAIPDLRPKLDRSVKYGTLAGADELPTVILKQGKAVEPQPCGIPFTKGDARELGWYLENSEGTDAGF